MAFDMGGLAAPVQLTKQNIDAYSTQEVFDYIVTRQWRRFKALVATGFRGAIPHQFRTKLRRNTPEPFEYACAIGEIMTAAQWMSYHGRHRSLLMGLMCIHDTVGYIDRAGPIWTEEWRRLARDEDLKVPQEVDHGI